MSRPQGYTFALQLSSQCCSGDVFSVQYNQYNPRCMQNTMLHVSGQALQRVSLCICMFVNPQLFMDGSFSRISNVALQANRVALGIAKSHECHSVDIAHVPIYSGHQNDFLSGPVAPHQPRYHRSYMTMPVKCCNFKVVRRCAIARDAISDSHIASHDNALRERLFPVSAPLHRSRISKYSLL